jgi:hypothetical protein
MMKNHLLLLIALFAALTGYALTGRAQTENTKLPELKGEWKLDSIVLYKYFGVDSTMITNDLLPKNAIISGVFDTIYFEKDLCRVNIGQDSFDATYRQNGNSLDIMLLAVPHTYTVTKNKNLLTLYHKYSISDNENNIMLYYGVKLIYQMIDNKHFDYE